MRKQPIIAFLGGGHITQSLMKGLEQSSLDLTQMWVTDREEEKLAHLKKQFAVQTSISNTAVANLAEVLFLAVKPQDTYLLVTEIKDILKAKKPLIISSAVGIHTQAIEQWAGVPLPIIQVMSNALSVLRVGTTGLYGNARVSDPQKDLAESLLRTVGITIWVNHEHDLDLVNALSGSGPAYFFLIMEALQQGAEKLGLPSRTARLLTLQTALGAARMALESEASLADLTQYTVLPGGATEKALEVLETGGIRSLLQKALEAARNRTGEISHFFDENNFKT